MIRTIYKGNKKEAWKQKISPLVTQINRLEKEEKKVDEKYEAYMVRNSMKVGVNLTTAEYYSKLAAFDKESAVLNQKKHELKREYQKLVNEMDDEDFNEQLNSI